MRDHRRLPYAILTPRIPGATDSDTNLLVALSASQAPLAARIRVSAPLINGLDPCPNALFVFVRRHGVQRNAAARRYVSDGDTFERGRRHRAAAGVAVRGHLLAEEDAQDGNGSTDDGDGGFDGGPDRDVLAVVGEVCLPQLNYVGAFYDCADTGSVMLLVCELAMSGLSETYKRPMLIAMPTPIFSRVRICRPQIKVQGSRAR